MAASWSVAQFQFRSILAGVHRLRPPLAGGRCYQAGEETLGRFFFFFFFQDQRGCPPPVLSPPSEQHSRHALFISTSVV
jgi:hypothetical protein